MFYKNIALIIVIVSFFPLLGIKPTISREQARDIFKKKKSFWVSNSYSECYNVLNNNDSFKTYNCRIIAEHLHRAREYFLNKDIRRQPIFNEIKEIDAIRKNHAEKKDLIEEALKDSSYSEDERTILYKLTSDLEIKLKHLDNRWEQLVNAYHDTYWETLLDRDKNDLYWAIEDGELASDVHKELARIREDLEI